METKRAEEDERVGGGVGRRWLKRMDKRGDYARDEAGEEVEKKTTTPGRTGERDNGGTVPRDRKPSMSFRDIKRNREIMLTATPRGKCMSLMTATKIT